MSWGLQTAEETGYQCWLEATELGRMLYSKLGYQVLFKITFDTNRDRPTGEWRKLQHELTPEPFYVMWKPGRDQRFEGDVALPWKVQGRVQEMSRG